MTDVLIKEDIWTDIVQRDEHVRTQGEDGFSQGTDRGLDQTPPSFPSEETHPADFSDF